MTLSIRTLLIAVAFIAFAVAALTSGGIVATLFHVAVGICIVAAAITTVVGVQRLRAVAGGFTVPATLYSLLLYAAGGNEFDPHNGSLPTTRIARYAYEAIYRPIYTDMQTGKVVPNYEPTSSGFGGGGMPAIAMTGEFPVRSVYMTTFHASVLLLAGSAGALYAGWIYTVQARTSGSG